MPPVNARRLKASIKAGVLAIVVALLVIAAVGGGTGGAATPSCGNTCIELTTPVYGTLASPTFVLADATQAPTVGQPLTMALPSASNSGEDFEESIQGTVDDFIQAGLADQGLHPLYGSLFAFEFEYAPFGIDSGLCMGVPSTPGNGTRVDLEACGVSARTVWIEDNLNSHDGSNVVLVSLATSSNFSTPPVLSTLLPGQPLFTSSLRTVTSGASSPNQRWRLRMGPF
jgi:hypothetical protein